MVMHHKGGWHTPPALAPAARQPSCRGCDLTGFRLSEWKSECIFVISTLENPQGHLERAKNAVFKNCLRGSNGAGQTDGGLPYITLPRFCAMGARILTMEKSKFITVKIMT